MTREEALEWFKDRKKMYCLDDKCQQAEDMAIKALEQEQKTGHWINVNKGKWNTIPACKCSECGANADLRDWSGESPFCPWCGAKMTEPQESEDKDEHTD